MTLKIKKKKITTKWCWHVEGKARILPLSFTSNFVCYKKTHNPKLGIFFYMKFKRVPGKQ